MTVTLCPCGTRFEIKVGRWANTRPLSRLDSFIALYVWLAKRRPDAYGAQLQILRRFKDGLAS